MAGSAKSYCYQPYTRESNTEDQTLWDIFIPHLRPMRELARMGVWRSRLDRTQGRFQQSIEDCLVIARTGSHWQGKGIVVEQLIGCAMSNLGHEEILKILANHEFSAAELKHLQENMLQIYPEKYPLLNIEGERLGFMDFVQRSFTDGGPGGGHLIPGLWEEFTDPDIRDKRFLMPLFTASCMAHARRDATISKANEIYALQSKMARMTPYERYVSGIKTADEIMDSSWSNYRFFLIGIFMPATPRASELVFRNKIQHEAVITILALLRWQLEKGQYPLTLDELVAAGFLKELPMDPWSDKPLVYRKTDDSFTLYSVGKNFVDDGGEFGVLDSGRISNWLDNGDTIFWPQVNMEQIKINRKHSDGVILFR